MFTHRSVSKVKANISSTPKTHLIRGAFYVLLLLTGTLLVYSRPAASTKVSPRTLTFAQRVSYQRAIEEVYWRHRIWPKENPNPKPSVDAVMSQSQLENKVADYLRDSLALENHGQSIAVERLQTEMDRMAQNTKQPEVLRELFEALGNDPFVIAECLAKSVLSERLVANFEYDKEPLDSALPRAEKQLPKLLTRASANYTLPTIPDAPNGCVDNTWTATSTINAPTGRYEHTAVWTGSEMIVWGGEFPPLNTGGRYNPSTDSWTATSTTNAPSARYDHTAVWTGREMIVWGAGGKTGNTGGRYNPITDSWTATSTVNAPSGRAWNTAVWTGSEMIVWGGFDGSELNTGGRYDPGTDSWTATSTTNAPTARFYHTAVWTGSAMIVWGGRANNSPLGTGGRYYPGTDSWTATSGLASSRYLHTAVWTGSEMIVWGGQDNQFILNTGGRYDPGADSWTATNTTNSPSAREFHTAAWTGSEMIVWGGFSGPVFNTGGKYNPGTNSWTATSTTNAPSARDLHTAVWTGSEMIIWGGEDRMSVLNSGGRYCAQSGASTPTPTPTATFTPTPTAEPTPTPSPAGCSVISSLCGTIGGGTPPTDFTVNLSRPGGGVQGSDFMVNGTPANEATVSNGGTTITFHFNASPVVEGLNTMHIPPCAFPCGDPGGCVYEFTCTFTYQPSAPTPTATATPTASPTPTHTPPTPTVTATATHTPTATATATPTATPTLTPRPSPTPRPALTPRPRPTPPP